ncbi:hydroxymethylbilane synthase [Brachybacterium timonense]|uniref:hydroxymethylbilane synthase n=1 Tax=Brachybacterium timonense TaxID=2050896 RepID=UPI000D0B8192|nr:hydroxymethylbilane synthase [Brachybacterium timonense]
MTKPHTIRVGTRGSLLARTQSRSAIDALTAGIDARVELVEVRTQGDVDRRPLATIGGTGVFVTAVRQALLDGEVDVIVHSCKDLPTAPADGITLACIPPREDPRDALVTRDGAQLMDLPSGARLGTGSPRRAAQLRRARPDLEVVAIRGNIDTRIARARGPQADLDGVILALSGLRRAGRDDVVAQALEPEVMLPAPAQGALAIECREADAAAESWLGALLAAGNDAHTRAAVTAERSLLATLEAGCSAPVAAHAVPTADGLSVRALAISPDGRTVVAGERHGLPSAAAALGRELAGDLLARGAADLLAAARSTAD